MTLGRYGTGAAARHAVVLRARCHDGGAPDETAAARAERIERMYFRGAAYDSYERGRWVRSRRPELRTVVEHESRRSRAWIHELDEAAAVRHAGGDRAAGDRGGRDPGVGAVRVDRAGGDRAAVAAAGGGGNAAAWRRAGRARSALRVGGDSDGFITLAHAHYVAYARPRRAGHPRRPQQGLTTAARGAYLALPPGLAPRLQALAEKVDAGLEMSDKITAAIRWLRSGH